MKKNNFKLFICLLGSSISLLGGCKSSPIRWNYNKSDISSFICLEALLDDAQEIKTISYEGYDYLFDNDIDLLDVKLYNYTKASNYEESESLSTNDYVTYQAILDNEIEIRTINNTFSSFNISFTDNSIGSEYRLLFHKDSNVKKEYIDVKVSKNISAPKESYDEDRLYYLSLYKSFSKSDLSNGLLNNTINHLSGSNEIINSKQISSFLSTYNSPYVFNNTIEKGNLIATLTKIENSLGFLSNEIFDFYNYATTNSLFDKLLISESNAQDYLVAINKFYYSDIYTLDLMLFEIKEDIISNLIDFINKSDKVEIDLNFTVKDNKFSLVGINNQLGSDSIDKKITIDSFTKTKAFLATNNDCFDAGLFNYIYQDIQSSVERDGENNVPSIVLIESVFDQILDEITKKYALENSDKISSLADKVLDLFSLPYGIIDTYLTLLSTLYTFGKEIKDVIINLLSSLSYKADLYYGLLFAFDCLTSSNYEHEVDNYIDLKDKLYNYCELFLESIDNNYFSLIGHNVNGGFYRARYNLNTDSEDTIRSNFSFSKADVDYQSKTVIFKDQSVKDHQFLSAEYYEAIYARLTYFKEKGYIDRKTSFLNYLIDNAVIDKKTIYCFDYLSSINYINKSANRFASSLIFRKATPNDKNITVTCTIKGDKRGRFFNLSWSGKYANNHNLACWSGQVLETVFFDGNSGERSSDTVVTMSAIYNETSDLWRYNEHYGFVNNPNGSYFYMIEI